MFRCLQGTVRFENGLSLSNCNGQRGTVAHAGNGGGIYNWQTGNMVFKGEELGISDCGYNVSTGVSTVRGVALRSTILLPLLHHAGVWLCASPIK